MELGSSATMSIVGLFVYAVVVRTLFSAGSNVGTHSVVGTTIATVVRTVHLPIQEVA